MEWIIQKKPNNHYSGPNLHTSKIVSTTGKPIKHAAAAKTTADTPHYSSDSVTPPNLCSDKTVLHINLLVSTNHRPVQRGQGPTLRPVLIFASMRPVRILCATCQTEEGTSMWISPLVFQNVISKPSASPTDL